MYTNDDWFVILLSHVYFGKKGRRRRRRGKTHALQGLYSFTNTGNFEEDRIFKYLLFKHFEYSSQLHTLKSNVRVLTLLSYSILDYEIFYPGCINLMESKMESCAPGLTSWKFVFCFFLYQKIIHSCLLCHTCQFVSLRL